MELSRYQPATADYYEVDEESPANSGRESSSNDANCLGVDPELFFPEQGASTREAKEVCRGCQVREECLESALQNNEKFGIWGGLSARERRRILRQRAQAARGIINLVSE